MHKLCQHLNCAVCTNVNERIIFRPILQTLYPDIYICTNAVYQVINSNGEENILTSLRDLKVDKKGYYIFDMYTFEKIYLNRNNFFILCSKNGKCNSEPFVLEYNILKQEKSS